jgi:hypothetical protein
VTWRTLCLLLLIAWALLTLGLTMAFESLAVPPIMGSIALGAFCYPYARKMYVDSLAKRDEGER